MSDLLLLLMWNNPKEVGTFTGKFFEYIGARRPILCVGGDNSPPALIIKERALGFVSFNANEICNLLIKMINEKRTNGHIKKTPIEAGSGFTRKEQAIKLANFLEEIIS